MNETEWQAQVVEIATMFGWEWVHFRPAKTAHGWRTPVSGPLGKGWPDLFLVRTRDHRRIAAELKSETGKPSPDQLAVLAILRDAGFETHIWRPSELELVAGILR